MRGYSLGLGSESGALKATMIPAILRTIETRWPAFFPASLPLGPHREVQICRAAEFHPEMITPVFRTADLQKQSLYLSSSCGIELDARLTDGDRQGWNPTGIGIAWPESGPTPELSIVEGLLEDWTSQFGGDSGYLTDDVTLLRDDLVERGRQIDRRIVECLYWVTWFGPEQVALIGEAPFRALAERCHVRPMSGGRLVRIQDEPFRADLHEGHRLEMERVFGLAEIHRRFPVQPF